MAPADGIAVGATTKTIAVAVVGDRVAEQGETFTLNLTGVTQGPAVLGLSSTTGSIVDND